MEELKQQQLGAFQATAQAAVGLVISGSVVSYCMDFDIWRTLALSTTPFLFFSGGRFILSLVIMSKDIKGQLPNMIDNEGYMPIQKVSE